MGTCINCVWEEFNVPLKRFIKKRVANEHDADDILQEIFIKIHSNIESLIIEATKDEEKVKISKPCCTPSTSKGRCC